MTRPVDVAIVGAGVTGLSVAWHLSQRPRRGSVVVLERTGIGAEASGIQPGGVRQQWTTAVNCRMARESVVFYRDFSQRVKSRAQPRFEPCGYLFVAQSNVELEELRDAVGLQNELGVPSEILDPEDASKLVPGLRSDGLVGAAYCAEDGYVDKPQAVLEAFAEDAQRRGVTIEHAPVRKLAPDGGGWRLELDHGRRLSAGQVVIAAGYGSPGLLRGLDVRLPIHKEPRFLFLSDPIRERLLEPLVVVRERRFAAKQLASGRVLASDLGARDDPDSSRDRWRRRIGETISELLPRLEYVSFPLLVEGFYDMTPDNLAILGSVSELPGLWLAAGFSGHGFMMAPAVGRSLAAALDGEETRYLDELSVERFERRELLLEQQSV